MMRTLEFENFDTGGNSDEDSPENSELYIEYSIKMVDFLKVKASEHNAQESNRRVSLDQLKEVFINSSSSYIKNEQTDINTHVLARVNMFLAIKAGRELKYDTNIKSKDLLDASVIIVPTEQDYIQAEKDIKEHNLDLDYQSIDNLYINTENEELDFNWE
jgi:hypothetical protein